MAINAHYHECMRMVDKTLKHFFNGIYERFRPELEVARQGFRTRASSGAEEPRPLDLQRVSGSSGSLAGRMMMEAHLQNTKTRTKRLRKGLES
jgi:aspartyl/asparaginyl-tRNA synthetase